MHQGRSRPHPPPLLLPARAAMRVAGQTRIGSRGASRRATAMTESNQSPVARFVRRLVHLPGVGDLPDAQLLERLVARRDEVAFEVLIGRHGPKVLGVCRRVLRQEQDAEDAFQATFLLLVRKAAAIGRGQAVGPWLYRVAYRVALRAQGLAGERPAR